MQKDKVILITGASRGIGAATAIMAAGLGYTVAVNYLRDEQAALRTVKAIQEAGGNAEMFRADVSDERQVADLFEKIDRIFGKIDGMVNNAGILKTQMRLDEMDADRVLEILSANVLSCFLCSKEAVKRMSTRYGGAGGSIVNVSSVAARTGSPGEYIDYAASKGAIDSMTIGLSKEVAAEGIRVNAVRPGFIYTDIHTSGGDPRRIERISSSIPMQRGGQPEEVAHAILWLLSDEASFTTGSFIDIAGGR